MNQKIGRNDPCPCGSGKKYKQCCLLKKTSGGKRKLAAKWLNAPAGPNLIERTFGTAIESTGKDFKATTQPDTHHEKKESKASG